MKIAVAGLGAVGGLIAARLALAGHEVSALARGATLRAVREHGLRLHAEGQVHTVPLRASDDPATLGPQELLVIAVKGQALPALAPALHPLIDAHTTVLPAMNGVPWWFLRAPALGLAPHAQDLASVDPQGAIGRALPLSQVLGCVLHLSAAQLSPGVVAHAFGKRVIVGEPWGPATARVERIAQVFTRAGFEAEASSDMRQDIWFKLWGNMTTNPVSALTGATADRLLDDPLVRGFMLRAMAEAAAIGERVGCPIHQSGEDRLAVTRQLGAFKTSMLQDSEAGRSLEIGALVGAVREIGERVGVATPHIDTIFGLTRLMAQTRGLYPSA